MCDASKVLPAVAAPASLDPQPGPSVAVTAAAPDAALPLPNGLFVIVEEEAKPLNVIEKLSILCIACKSNNVNTARKNAYCKYPQCSTPQCPNCPPTHFLDTKIPEAVVGKRVDESITKTKQNFHLTRASEWLVDHGLLEEDSQDVSVMSVLSLFIPDFSNRRLYLLNGPY